ncbi:histidine phosphatase family protein, partial [Mycobacterium avium]|uniref:histidine phosphatase family protein n=1 Tax=Mycobacterium avium TaxID=1764 RepID=UPI001CE15356
SQPYTTAGSPTVIKVRLHTAAVTHPAVIRAAIAAALDADPASFWRVDVAPAAYVVMHHRGGRWTLRL